MEKFLNNLKAIEVLVGRTSDKNKWKTSGNEIVIPIRLKSMLFWEDYHFEVKFFYYLLFIWKKKVVQ